jgi:hypothetical protein
MNNLKQAVSFFPSSIAGEVRKRRRLAIETAHWRLCFAEAIA